MSNLPISINNHSEIICQVTNHLFDRLQKSIEGNCSRLDELDGRVAKAAKKVEMLQDSKKVCVLFNRYDIFLLEVIYRTVLTRILQL